MEYSKLPVVKEDQFLRLEHFPSRFHAAVFRLWETVPAENIAVALGQPLSVVLETAEAMGLPKQQHTERWGTRGYITTIRNAWHVLPYDQLLAVLGWNEDQLATVLKEDDFLYVKLGRFKPYCPPVRPEPLSEAQKARLAAIKECMTKHFDSLFEGAIPFDFFSVSDAEEKDAERAPAASGKGLRMIYSYCGLYATALDADVSFSYPEEMLRMYQKAGVNAIWLHVALYQLVPFPFDLSYSEGWEMRQKRLRELIERAGAYGIQIFLYLNEPRCMPLSFFEKHPDLLGHRLDSYGALCSSDNRTEEYLRYAVRKLCTDVPGLGGFFCITCSENLTNCKSSNAGIPCERCRDASTSKIVADVLTAISEESRAVDPTIRTIAWTWAWEDYMTAEEIRECIDRLPKEIIVQCNSEAKKEFVIGGVRGAIRDYSMSIPGPAPFATDLWSYARARGHEVSAKVQVNVTWECSTLPFLPVFDLIREHMSGLSRENVKHLMLSWTLGGYPSINLKVACECLEDDSEKAYDALLAREYGDDAETVKRAARLFSAAFREFPFDIRCAYYGPQNGGPSNLLYPEPSGFLATMTCYAYDEIDKWRNIYPREVYVDQFRKLSEKWQLGLDAIEDLPESDFKLAAWGGYALFRSSYLQADFIVQRDAGNTARMLEIAEEEKKLALLTFDLMKKNNLLGYEAANHYYFNKGMLAEKVLNCEYVMKLLKK